MVFHSRDALNYFVEKGQASGAQADAAAKTSDKGGAVAGEAIVSSNISVYQLTKSGLALQATIKGTKFWKNHELTEQGLRSNYSGLTVQWFAYALEPILHRLFANISGSK